MILKKTPKIKKEHCRINWDDAAENIHNLIRGLSPYPGAYTELQSPDGKIHGIKIYRSTFEKGYSNGMIGGIMKKGNQFAVITGDGLLYPLELQPSGKKAMSVSQFLNGYRLNDNWKVYK